jgi:hypothetical protein
MPAHWLPPQAFFTAAPCGTVANANRHGGNRP